MTITSWPVQLFLYDCVLCKCTSLVVDQEMDSGADTKKRHTHFTVYGYDSVGQNNRSAHNYLDLEYAFSAMYCG